MLTTTVRYALYHSSFFFLAVASRETFSQHVWCRKNLARDTDLRFLSALADVFSFILIWCLVFWMRKNHILCSCSSSCCYWMQVQWHNVTLDRASTTTMAFLFNAYSPPLSLYWISVRFWQLVSNSQQLNVYWHLADVWIAMIDV